MRVRNSDKIIIPSLGSFLRLNRRSPQTWKGTEGVAAVEFGLLLPILMLVLVGIIEYGYVFYVDLVLANAAREGARAGVTVQGTPCTTAQSVATGYLTSNLPGSVTGSATCTSNTNVVVQVTVNPFVPLIGYLPHAALPAKLVASSSMRWEWSP
jgi:Flp pilus assembly protein TadG